MEPSSASSTNQTPTPDPNAPRAIGRKRSRPPALALATVGAVLTAVAAYDTIDGLEAPDDPTSTPVAGPRASYGDPAAARASYTPRADPHTPRADPRNRAAARPEAVPRTTDPISYATAIAALMFGWNTTTDSRTDLLRLLTAEATPPRTETSTLTSDLLSDLVNYLPSEQAWEHLADYQTRQRLAIDDASVPEAWQAAASAGADLPTGAVAVTIDGIRHRGGYWDDETVSTEHDVAFTVFVACPPAGQRCRLLRLSIPNQPLR